MSDLEQDRPLTRRERRLREMVETGAVPTIDSAEQLVREHIAAAPVESDDIEISPFDENGQPRTRREMRELREQALAARAAGPSQAEPVQAGAAAPPVAPESPADTGDEPEPPADAPAAPEFAVSSESAFPDLAGLGAPAMPSFGEPAGGNFDLSDLLGGGAADDRADAAPSAEREEPQAAGDETIEFDLADIELAATQPFSLDELHALADADPAPGADAHVDEAPFALEPEDSDERERDEDSAPAVEAEPIVELEPEPETEIELEMIEVEADSVDEAHESDADVTDAKPNYSFPDITPLDDHVSVFDDPALRTATAPASDAPLDGGDFDALISRAVAQETSSTTAGTSALILPSLPDTGDLTGPLGGTGELFITGSIALPKSLGETGGHAPTLDAGDADHFDELGFGGDPTTSNPIMPVSATRAVSAVTSTGGVVKQETKEKRKLPVVLISLGGGLVVVVGGLLVWGMMNGMFG